MNQLSPFSGPVWRLISVHYAATPEIPVTSPEGRFHHDGEFAIYASLSAEGAGVAIRRYLGDGVSRVLVPMRLETDRVADIRGTPEASIVWQGIRESGSPSPTWTFSDAARRAGAQAMLYSSRSRPDLSHVVVFQPDLLSQTGAAEPFVAQ